MKEKIIELRKKGYTIKQIVEELNCAKSTVSYHIKGCDLGGNINTLVYDVNKTTINKIIELRNEGKTYDEILLVIDITKDKLVNICRKLDIRKIKKHDYNELFQNQVVEFYLNVKSLRKTAEHFNLPRYIIRGFISDNDVNNINNNRKKISKSESVISWRKRRKIELVKYKGGKCEICGYDKSIRALQFHHKSPKGKDFTISGKSYSKETLIKEVDKCILVCSNCHHEIHEKWDNLDFKD